MKKPTIIERFTDNGEHSHYELFKTETGELLWSEDVEEYAEQGLSPDEIKLRLIDDEQNLLLCHLELLLINIKEFHPNSVVLKSNCYKYLEGVCNIL